MKRTLYIAAMGLSVFTAASALASQGYVTRDVSLRAGPDSSYPRVSMLGAGTVVFIEGCTNDWSWCDVASEDSRGWMAGAFLQDEYQGRRVLVPAYGVQIGIPIITFELDRYWGNYYRDRPWYGERERWSHDRHPYQPAAIRHGPYGNDHGYGNDHAYGNDHGTSYRNSHDVTAPDTRPSYGAHSRDGGAVRPSDSGATRDGPTNRMAQQRPVETDHRPPAGNAAHARQDEYKAHETAAPRKDEQNRSKGKQDEEKDNGQH